MSNNPFAKQGNIVSEKDTADAIAALLQNSQGIDLDAGLNSDSSIIDAKGTKDIGKRVENLAAGLNSYATAQGENVADQVIALVGKFYAGLRGEATSEVEEVTGGNNSATPGLSQEAQTAIRQMLAFSGSAENLKGYHRLSSTDKVRGNLYAPADLEAGLNAFDNSTMYEGVSLNIMYAPAQIAQSALADAIFKPEVMTPDKDYYEIRTLVPTLHQETDRSTNGDLMDFVPRRLVDATRYHQVLGDEDTKIVPAYKVSRADKFVDPALIAPTIEVVNGVEITTNYLKPGVTLDLVALNFLEDKPNRGKSNTTDSLDRAIEVSKIALRVSQANDTDRTVFELDVNGKLGSNFTAAANTESETMQQLVMPEQQFFISAESKVAGNVVPAALADILALNENVVIKLGIGLHGHADTEGPLGQMVDQKGSIRVLGIYERGVDGNFRRTTVTDSAIINLVNAQFAKMSVVGYKLDARLSNYGRRDPGTYCRVQAERRQFPVQLNAPFSVRVAAGRDGAQAEKAELIKIAYAATRISNDMEAHRVFIKALDTMRQNKGLANETDDFKWTRFGYAADSYITYDYEEIELDVLKQVQNVSSKTKLDDITSILALNVSDIATKLIYNTGLNSALALLGNPDYKVEIIAGTDPYTAGYLRMIGDSRTAGKEHKLTVISTMDERWRDRISISFRVTLDNDCSLLNFGKFVNMPRYMTDLLMNVAGATVEQVMIQTRRQYIVTCPIGAWINVKNLSKAVRQNIPLKVQI